MFRFSTINLRCWQGARKTRSPLFSSPTARDNTAAYAYDSLDRLITQANSLNQTTTYVCDKANRLIERTDADGRLTHFQYDAKSRLTKTEYYEVGGIDPYQVAGRTQQIVYPVGATVDYGYSSTDRVTQVAHNLSGPATISYTYAYDSRGNLVSEADEGDVYSFTYDVVPLVIFLLLVMRSE